MLLSGEVDALEALRVILVLSHDQSELLAVQHGQLVGLQHAQLEILLGHQRLILLQLRHELFDLLVYGEELLSALGMLRKLLFLLFNTA
jgi:hypothetical protein